MSTNTATPPSAPSKVSLTDAANEFRNAWEAFFRALAVILLDRVTRSEKYSGEFRQQFVEKLQSQVDAITADQKFLMWLENLCWLYSLFGSERVSELQTLAIEMQMFASTVSPPMTMITATGTASPPQESSEYAKDAEVIKGSVEKFTGKIVKGAAAVISHVIRPINHKKFKERTEQVLPILNEGLKIFARV